MTTVTMSYDDFEDIEIARRMMKPSIDLLDKSLFREPNIKPNKTK